MTSRKSTNRMNISFHQKYRGKHVGDILSAHLRQMCEPGTRFAGAKVQQYNTNPGSTRYVGNTHIPGLPGTSPCPNGVFGRDRMHCIVMLSSKRNTPAGIWSNRFKPTLTFQTKRVFKCYLGCCTLSRSSSKSPAVPLSRSAARTDDDHAKN